MLKSEQQVDDEEYGVPDADSPEWTAEKFAGALRFNELPEEMRRTFSAIQEGSRKRRGLQKAPTKKPVTIRLSPDVLEVLRGKGRGWQTLVDQALREKFLKAKA
jgi:uncharacterized protein (DUF4415 family)